MLSLMRQRLLHRWILGLVTVALLAVPLALSRAAADGSVEMVICGAGGPYTATLPGTEDGHHGHGKPLCCLICAAPALPPAARAPMPMARRTRRTTSARQQTPSVRSRPRRPHPVRAPPVL
jgi:hypothetical protein